MLRRPIRETELSSGPTNPTRCWQNRCIYHPAVRAENDIGIPEPLLSVLSVSSAAPVVRRVFLERIAGNDPSLAVKNTFIHFGPCVNLRRHIFAVAFA